MLLEGADLIDGTGGPVVRDAIVLLEGDRIRYAGPRTTRFDGLPARRWPLAGKTLIPGLIEAHTHASFDSDMVAYLKNGVTTIRFAGMDQTEVARLRARVDRGDPVGPRILSCGRMIDQPPVAYLEWSIAVESPSEAAAAAERQIVEEKVEALIVTQRVEPPVMRAVIEVAHAHGRSVIGQTWAVDGKEAADLGIDELHNSSRVFISREFPRDRLLRYSSISDRLALSGRGWATIDWEATRPLMDAMVERGVRYCGMHVIARFQAGEGAAELMADADFVGLFGQAERDSFQRFTRRLQGSWTQADLDHWRIANDNRLEWVRRYRAMGGVLLIGTDMQFGGIMFHHELRNLAALGISPLEVIAMATGGSAHALGMEAWLGTIREGRAADIVVLDRDPSKDLGALRDVAFVIKGGAVLWANRREQNRTIARDRAGAPGELTSL